MGGQNAPTLPPRPEDGATNSPTWRPAHIQIKEPHETSATSVGTTSTNTTTQDHSIEAQQRAAAALERSSGLNLRSNYRTPLGLSDSNGHTIRAVTPDMQEVPDVAVAGTADAPHLPRGVASHDSSPRSIPGGVSRRQGMVFNDSFGDSYESSESSPPAPTQRLASSTIRPRTRTVTDAMLTGQQRAQASTITDGARHRVGSVSSSGSQAVGGNGGGGGSGAPVTAAPAVAGGHEETRMTNPEMASLGFPAIAAGRGSETSVSSSATREKRTLQPRRLTKRHSRPASPLSSHPPSVDSLPFPVTNDDPRKIMMLMLALCGKMRGEIEYQDEVTGPWHAGVAYIDDEKGNLMFDSGQNGPFHVPILPDLRGCRVLPVDYPEANRRCIELVCAGPFVEVLLHPLIEEDFDMWLAALLCWQQLRPGAVKLSATQKPNSPVSPVRPELKKRGYSADGLKTNTIIKVGKIQVWDKGPAPGTRALVKRSSTRDTRSPAMSWKRVSCILTDNGEFKLMTENDITILAVIDMSQLSRCSIQYLDHTVLDEEHCVVIFPTYAAGSTRLSIWRPVYLALDNRTHFEVWFSLLRAFTVPDVYHLDDPDKDQVMEIDDVEKDHNGEVFRLEKVVTVRVTEAKMRAKQQPLESPATNSQAGARTPDADGTIGNYFAEVILDGEIRSRTTTKMGTKNPFWREDCEFADLPPSIPHLSVVFKRLEGFLDSIPATPVSSGSSKLLAANEIVCGTVDIPLASSEPSTRDQESWLPIVDDRQETIGSMLIKVTYEEHVVLLAREYKALGEILHNFTTGLTTLIAAALPGHLRRLAELFLNIFQVSGSASDWLLALVEDEIDGVNSQATMKKYRFSTRLQSNESNESTSDRELILRDMNKTLSGEANLLFRGNTLLTQALEFHMRRLSKDFLEDTLQGKLYEINELNPDCEVDPSKITQTDLDLHWELLLKLTTDLWQAIVNGAKKIHPELRHILKYIRAVAEDRYGDFLRTVAYTSVSGFLFLRFICPAILSPKLFGLLRDHPRPRAQRTFTLIAKALQKLANLSTFGKREEWMEPMNRFLNAQRPSFKEYVDAVCDIPAERGPRTLPASYSTPVTILSRLGPTAREGFPSLPFLIDQARNYASLIKLWVDTKPSDPSKRLTMEGDLLIFNDFCVSLQQRADACLAKVESVRQSDLENAATDELADILEQASLVESLSYSYPGTALWNDVDRRPGSSSSDDTPPEPTASASAATSEVSRRRSKELRPGRELFDVRRTGGLRHVSAGGPIKTKNGKKGRTILSGIMRIGGRAESPDSKKDKEK
ncbi:hypothetical protein N3K66_005061 [Trichothecium roseum]|uniref:Uncharacterized protein n=1 Tax=Trichothecium roseum TaxID=47278 RepID=A0ACC0V4H2_9HYPO|nr:hypothetical protein N3K66_005061 [Trichothecium roseum]